MTEKHGAGHICATCGNESKSIPVALRHQARAHGNMMKCKACDREFSDYVGFRAHWYVHEGASKSHVCETCGKAFYLKFQLNEHIKRSHGNKHKCPHCDFQHGRSWNLKVHMRSHKNKN